MSSQAVAEALAALGLGKSRLIKDTTREERIEIIHKSLSWCGEEVARTVARAAWARATPMTSTGPT